MQRTDTIFFRAIKRVVIFVCDILPDEWGDTAIDRLIFSIAFLISFLYSLAPEFLFGSLS